LGVSERTLITQTNKFIADKRTGRQDAAGAANQQPSSITPQPSSIPQQQSATAHLSAVERMLIQAVIRHGEEVIFSDVEDEDGNLINMNVAQYIAFDLGNDDIRFANDLYNRVLAEAVEHSADVGFKAEQYFMQHPDPQVSQLAVTLGIDSHQLSRSFELHRTQDGLSRHVQHLVMDYRLGIVNQKMKDINRQLKEQARDMERVRELMDEYKQVTELRNILARQLGAGVIVS
jgi:DNA primase